MCLQPANAKKKKKRAVVSQTLFVPPRAPTGAKFRARPHVKVTYKASVSGSQLPSPPPPSPKSETVIMVLPVVSA
jgi:hypothetical protein